MIRTIAGDFPQGLFGQADFDQGVPYALGDGLFWGVADAAGVKKSSGAVRVVPVSIQPSLVERWQVLGFSVRLQTAISWLYGSVYANVDRPYGRVGDIWAGALIDAPMAASGGAILGGKPFGAAQLPQDMSTFTKVVDADEPRPILNATGPTAPQNVVSIPAGQGLFGTTFMFPVPQVLHSGSQLQMALIALPSKIGRYNVPPVTNGWILFVQSCSYTVIYDDGSKDKA